MATFASCIFSEPRAARFRPGFYIRTKATPCVEVWQTSNLPQLRLGEEKDRKKMSASATQGSHNQCGLDWGVLVLYKL